MTEARGILAHIRWSLKYPSVRIPIKHIQPPRTFNYVTRVLISFTEARSLFEFSLVTHGPHRDTSDLLSYLRHTRANAKVHGKWFFLLLHPVNLYFLSFPGYSLAFKKFHKKIEVIERRRGKSKPVLLVKFQPPKNVKFMTQFSGRLWNQCFGAPSPPPHSPNPSPCDF
jgi:hypothetical protein